MPRVHELMLTGRDATDTWAGRQLGEVVAVPGWNGSNRRDRLPANWEAIRRQVLNAPNGRKCKFENAYGELTCDEPATDVDHIRPGDDHSLGNLRSLCEYHHDQKSGAEGAQARAAQRRKINQKFRRREEHPGLL